MRTINDKTLTFAMMPSIDIRYRKKWKKNWDLEFGIGVGFFMYSYIPQNTNGVFLDQIRTNATYLYSFGSLQLNSHNYNFKTHSLQGYFGGSFGSNYYTRLMLGGRLKIKNTYLYTELGNTWLDYEVDKYPITSFGLSSPITQKKRLNSLTISLGLQYKIL